MSIRCIFFLMIPLYSKLKIPFFPHLIFLHPQHIYFILDSSIKACIRSMLIISYHSNFIETAHTFLEQDFLILFRLKLKSQINYKNGKSQCKCLFIYKIEVIPNLKIYILQLLVVFGLFLIIQLCVVSALPEPDRKLQCKAYALLIRQLRQLFVGY